MLRSKLLRARAGHRTADEQVDNLRPPVKLNLSLKGAQDLARRGADNQAALGGLRNPRISNHRIPNQRKVGKRVAHAIDSFLDLHPDVQLRVLNSIGVAKDKVPPPLPNRKWVSVASSSRKSWAFGGPCIAVLALNCMTISSRLGWSNQETQMLTYRGGYAMEVLLVLSWTPGPLECPSRDGRRSSNISFI